MNKFFGFILLLATGIVNAQNRYYNLTSGSQTEFLNTSNRREISALCYVDGRFYLPSEKGNIIYVTDANFNLLDALPVIYDKCLQLEIEAIRYYNGLFYLLDDKTGEVWYYKLGDNIAQKMTMTAMRCNAGNEGMAIDPVKGILYVLGEHNEDKKTSPLYAYQLGRNHTLTFINQWDLQLPLDKSRYSELTLNATGDMLLALGSLYVEKEKDKPDKSHYYINAFNIPSLKLKGTIPIDHVVDSCNLCSGFPVEGVTYHEPGQYSANFEGMTIGPGGKIYLSTDNKWHETDTLKTLILRID